MKSNSKEVILEFNLPEFSKKDLSVKLFKNNISIKAEKKANKKIQKKDFLHQEKSYRGFRYSTTLPKINPNKAKINFNAGVLKIIAPKI